MQRRPWVFSPGCLISVFRFLPLEVQGGSLVYSYGDDDLNRTVGAEDKVSEDEDSRDSISVSIWIFPFFTFTTLRLEERNSLVVISEL